MPLPGLLDVINRDDSFLDEGFTGSNEQVSFSFLSDEVGGDEGALDWLPDPEDDNEEERRRRAEGRGGRVFYLYNSDMNQYSSQSVFGEPRIFMFETRTEPPAGPPADGPTPIYDPFSGM